MIERRKTLEYLVGFQTVLLVMVVAGVSIIIILKGIDSRVATTSNSKMQIQLEDLVESHTQQTEFLVKANNKGYRFTAGNAWQMMQYVQHGKIDMSIYPTELKTVCGTWFNSWLEDQGILPEVCTH